MSKSTLSALVADPSSVVRLSLRQILQGLDVERIDTASTISETRRKLMDGRFDIVLCEFNFEGEETGQDLLEELRRKNVLPASTIFVVVTAERSYAKVVGVAEEAPDEYMLKPVQAGELSERLENAFDRRYALMEIYEALHKHEPDRALQIARQIMSAKTPYLTDTARLAGQILYRQGRLEEAITLYQALLAKRDLAWAKFGLANVALRQGDHDTAEKAMCDIIGNHTLYLPVYNQLSDLYLAQDRFADALDITEQAIRISPHSLRRLQLAGQLAYSLGDEVKAADYLGRAVRLNGKAANLEYRTIFHMLLIQLESGRGPASLSLLKQIIAKYKAEPNLERDPRGDWYGELAQAADNIAKREPLAAIDPMRKLSRQWQAPQADFNFMLDYLSIINRLHAEDISATLAGWIENLAYRFNVSRQAQELMIAKVADHERLVQMLTLAGDFINQTASEAARKLVENDYRAAADKLIKEGQRTRNNRLLLAAANAAAKCAQKLNLANYRSDAESCLSMIDPPPAETVVLRLRESMAEKDIM